MSNPFVRHKRDTDQEKSRGQSLVEFAMVIPVILLLTLIALDFGRIYLGYINLQNMARIAANYAANNPDAWGTTPNTEKQTQYRNQILADATESNCQLPVSGGDPVIPTPTFLDSNGDGTTKSLGDTVTVQVTCTFGVITPAISNVLGGSVAVSASSNFPVKAGMSDINGSGAVIVGTPPNAAFSANTTITPNSLTVIGPEVDVEFRDTSGGNPLWFAWNFADGTTSSAQDPLAHTFTCGVASCSYVVTMTATNALGSSTTSMTVVVIGLSDVNFTADSQSGTAPHQVEFTDTSTPGGTAWAWDFGDGQTGSGATATHTYTADGTYDVSLTVTYPSPVGAVTTTKDDFITVAVATCTVPELNNVRFNDAQAIWNAAKFTGTVIRDTGAPQGNFLIKTQSLVYPDPAPCTSDVRVSAP